VSTVSPATSPPARAQLPTLPALVVGQVMHRRPGPVRHAFRHRVYQWLVDLDSVPRVPGYLRPFAHFSSEDHLGDPRLTIKGNIENYLARGGIDLGDRGRVLMLAGARVLGHVFDPLSVFWCYDGNGVLVCVVAEVHNTYGERHAYLLRPDPATRRAVAGRLLRQPLMPQRISALIRMHGIWLWLHRLPIRPRPHHTRQQGV
jgi:DUF1365 family protein